MIGPGLPLTLGRAQPPLDPDGDEARGLLRRELVRPEYHETDPLQQLINWVTGLIDDSVAAAQRIPSLGAALGILVLLLIATGVILLVSRARRTARGASVSGPALGEERISADALRRRAEQALARSEAGAAVVDAFRALAVRQVELARIDDIPPATAHELARALGAVFPEQAGDLHRGADLFDAVLYGQRGATADQAGALLHLDDDLRSRRAVAR